MALESTWSACARPEVRKVSYRFFFSFHLADRYSPGTNPPWELQAKPRVSEEARLLVRGRGGHAPTAPSGPVWLCKAHLRISHKTTQRTPDAGAIGRSWCWLGRPGSIAQEKNATVYRRWAHHTRSRSLGCILYILRQHDGQRSVTLFSSAAAICCRRKASCIFWAAGSSSRALMISS